MKDIGKIKRSVTLTAGGAKMFYVYMDSPYGTELIGRSEDRKEAERIKAEQDAKWECGFMWSTRITDREEKEFSCFD